MFVSLSAGAGRDPEELFEELWRACAGPLVELPQTNERVFYFLQGHLEQVAPRSLLLATSFLKFSFMFSEFFSCFFTDVLCCPCPLQLQEPTDPALLAEQIKMFQVPNKILCKVVNVELKARTIIHSPFLSRSSSIWCQPPTPLLANSSSSPSLCCRPRQKRTRCTPRSLCSRNQM